MIHIKLQFQLKDEIRQLKEDKTEHSKVLRKTQVSHNNSIHLFDPNIFVQLIENYVDSHLYIDIHFH